MAQFLCDERRIVRRPDAANMGGPDKLAKAAQDEISVMFGSSKLQSRRAAKRTHKAGIHGVGSQKTWQAPMLESYSG
jgi:hypothetical protein